LMVAPRAPPHDALAGRRYRFEWVKGHVGHELNEAADVRARAVAEAYQRGLEIPAGPGWSGACETDAAAAAPEPVAEPADEVSDAEVVPHVDDDALFSLDEAPEAWHSVTLELSTEELERLRIRALAEGLSPEEYLRGLI
jgi:ribonuclease HI